MKQECSYRVWESYRSTKWVEIQQVFGAFKSETQATPNTPVNPIQFHLREQSCSPPETIWRSLPFPEQATWRSSASPRANAIWRSNASARTNTIWRSDTSIRANTVWRSSANPRATPFEVQIPAPEQTQFGGTGPHFEVQVQLQINSIMPYQHQGQAFGRGTQPQAPVQEAVSSRKRPSYLITTLRCRRLSKQWAAGIPG